MYGGYANGAANGYSYGQQQAQQPTPDGESAATTPDAQAMMCAINSAPGECESCGS